MNRFLHIFIALFAAFSVAAADNALVILHTNDTHSQIDPDFDGKGGVLRRKVIIDSIRAVCPNVILVDAGDVVQGTPYFNIYRGEVEVAMLDSLRYDFITLGNHEFDNGLPSMFPFYSRMRPHLLSTNYDLSRTCLKNIALPCEVRSVGNRNIGFIAANVNPVGLVNAENCEGLGYNNPLIVLDSVAGILKHSYGVDYVVMLSHLGYSYNDGRISDIDVAKASSNIDLIIGGHTHTLINPAKGNPVVKNRDGRDVLICQAGSLGKYLGKVEVNLDDLTASSSLIPVTKQYDSRVSPALTAALAPYKHKVDSIMSVKIAESAEAMPNRRSGAINHWNADMSLLLMKEFYDGKVDLSIMNQGGVRRPMPKGDVSEGLIMAMFPFENYLTVLEITGAQLKEAFRVLAVRHDNSVSRGVVIRYNPVTEEVNATINGKPIIDSKTYRILTLDYLAKGGDGMAVMEKAPRIAIDTVKYGNRVLPYIRSLGEKGIPITADPKPRLIYPTDSISMTPTPVQVAPDACSRATAVLQRLSLRDRIAQLILADVRLGEHNDDFAAALARVDTVVGIHHVGGIMIYKCDDYRQNIAIYNRAVSLSEVPIFSAADSEQGLRMRIRNAMRLPRLMTIGASASIDNARTIGRILGLQQRAIGTNVNFGPVLDVNSNPQNPVIGNRSFGDNPDCVATLGVAFAEGLSSVGVMPVAKHFPGHGDTSEDSHLTLPMVGKELNLLRDIDLAPFGTYISCGGYGVMCAHLNVPALDSSGTPSSLSAPIIQGVLRDEMQFAGLVFSDALDMKGVASPDAPLRALIAGNDVLVMPENPGEAIDRIERAVLSGEVPQSLIDSHCLRVLTAKMTFNITLDPIDEAAAAAVALPSTPEVDAVFSSAVTLLSPGDSVLPLQGKVSLVRVGARDKDFLKSPGDTVGSVWMPYIPVEHPSAASVSYIDRTAPDAPALDAALPVVVEVYNVEPEYIPALASLAASPGKVAFIFYTTPYLYYRVADKIGSDRNAVVLAYEDAPQLQRAAFSALFSGEPIPGRCPVKEPQ